MRNLSIYLLSAICAFALAPAAFAQPASEGDDQASASSLAGNYHLAGVMETAAPLQLPADCSYRLMLIVGSLDLYSEGKWTQSGGQVILGPHRFSEDRPVFALG